MTDIDSYFADTGLAQGSILDSNVIFHTTTRRYVLGKLGTEETIILLGNQVETILNCTYTSAEEYRQMVLESFEDTVNQLEEEGFMVDYDAEHI